MRTTVCLYVYSSMLAVLSKDSKEIQTRQTFVRRKRDTIESSSYLSVNKRRDPTLSKASNASWCTKHHLSGVLDACRNGEFEHQGMSF